MSSIVEFEHDMFQPFIVNNGIGSFDEFFRLTKTMTLHSPNLIVKIIPKEDSILLNNLKKLNSLIDSRIEVAAETRRGGRSCGCPPQVLHNKADAVRSFRLKGKFGRNFFWKTNGKKEKDQ
jgi:hypothetical protein